MEPVTLSPPPGLHGLSILRASEDGDGLIAEYESGLVRYRKDDGQFVAVWPTDLAMTPQAAPLLGVQCVAGRCLAIHPQGGLCVLYAQTLALVRTIDCEELLPGSTADDWCAAALGPAHGGAWLLLRGRQAAKLLRISLASDDRIEVYATVEWEASLSCRALCGVANGVVVATDGGLIRLPASGDTEMAQSVKLAHSCDRLWPSHDGCFVLATGHEARRFSLIACEAETCGSHMEGMYVAPHGPHTGGWLVWDKQDPDVKGATALSHPVVAWMDAANVAVIGNEQGQCLLIDAANATAVKLMTPPDQPVMPLAFVAPDSLSALSGNVAQRIVMAWRFSVPVINEAAPADGDAPATSPVTSDGEYSGLQRKSAPAWLGWAIAAAVGAAVLLLTILNTNSGQ